MKKLIVALSVGALMMGTTAMAADGENNGAIVINEDGVGSCIAQMWVRGYTFPLLLAGTDVHTVVNKNMTKTVCKLDMDNIPEWMMNMYDAEVPDSAVVIKDFSCVIWGADGIATSSKFVWTPSNEAQLQCTYKAPKD